MRRLAILLLLLFLLPRAAPAQSLGPSQSITVIDSGTACTTAPTACASYDPSTAPAVGITVSGTWTGTLTFEATTNSVVWNALLVTNTGTGSLATTTTANGTWSVGNGGFLGVRLRATGAMTGTAVVTATRGYGLSARAGSFAAGSGGAMVKPSGVLYADPASYVTLADTNYISNTAYTLPANTLTANGDSLRIEVMFNLGSDAGTKSLQCNAGYTAWSAAAGFTGGVNLMSFGTTAVSQTLVATATVRRASSVFGDSTSQGFFTTLGTWAGGVGNNGSYAWTTAIPILCHGKNSNAVAATVTLKQIRIIYEPAPS